VEKSINSDLSSLSGPTLLLGVQNTCWRNNLERKEIYLDEVRTDVTFQRRQTKRCERYITEAQEVSIMYLKFILLDVLILTY